MKTLAILAATLLLGAAAYSEPGTQLGNVKSYLLNQVTKLDNAAHDFDANADSYQKIINANGGDYSKAALAGGPEVLGLVKKMQTDYLNLHMNGYETIEGIAAGVRELVSYDIYFDSGVPKSMGSTDNPVAPVVLRDASGKTIVDRDGNLFHYVIEPCLYGAKSVFVEKLSRKPHRPWESSTFPAPTSWWQPPGIPSVKATCFWRPARPGSPHSTNASARSCG